jgi:diguanylate cyclase (GGDEF)-like protein/PAS domain S-box-containing protein
VVDKKMSPENGRFFDVSIDLLCIAGMEGYFKRVNPAFQQALGWSKEDLLRRPFVEFIHPEDVEPTLKEIEKLSQGKPLISFLNRFQCANGKYKTLQWSAYPEAETGLLYAVGRDTTELTRSHELFRMAIESSPSGILIVDPLGNIVMANSAAEDMLGFDHGELLDKTVEQLIKKELRDKHALNREQFLQHPIARPMGKNRDLTCLRKDGSEVHVEIGLNLVESEQDKYIICAFVDLTERLKAQAAIQASRQHLLSVLSSIDDLVIVIDKNRIVVDFHQLLASNQSGFMGKEFLNLPICEAGLPPQITRCFDQAMDSLEKSPKVQGFDFKFEQPSGVQWYSAKMSRRLDEKGAVVGFTVVARNITDRKLDEQRILTLADQLEKANHQLTKLATSDPLTGLKNRKFFFEELTNLVTLAQRKRWSISLLVADIDNFKAYNDQYGHPTGDKILIDVAHIIEKTTRESDLIARYGGEEFLIALPDTNQEGALVMGERIRDAIESSPWPHGDVTISIGAATLSSQAIQDEQIQELVQKILAEADKALYTSKASGRNQVTHIRDGL